MKNLSIILPFLFLISKVKCAKILAVEFTGTKSHVMTYVPLLDELTRRGHQVTLLSPSKNLPKEKGVREYFTFDVVKELEKDQDLDIFKFKETDKKLNNFAILGDIMPRLCTQVYQRPDIQALMNETFDLIIVQPIFNDCSFGLVHKIRSNSKKPTPLVLFTPFAAPNFIIEKIGGYYPPSFVSNSFLEFTDQMTFFERMANFGTNIGMELFIRFDFEPLMEKTYRNALNDQDIPSAREIMAEASILLTNGHFSLNRPRPYLPDVIEVGGIHSIPAKALPKDLEDFVAKNGDDGFILFSLGSAITSDTMPAEKRDIFLNVFSKLKQQVIWKLDSGKMPTGVKVPSNVKLVKWMPQMDLLGHKDIKIFMTHCGMGGTEEAIYHGVPLLGIPFYGDQFINAEEAKRQGFLLELDWNALTQEILLNDINQLINNRIYKENVMSLSRIFRDQIDSPLQRGVYWVEYVLRHEGAPHLKSASRKLNTIQYHSVDVIAAYLATIYVIFYLVFKLIAFIARKMCQSKNKKMTEGKKNK